MGWKSLNTPLLRAPLCSDDKWGTSTRENLGQNLSQCFLVQLQLDHHWPSSSLSSLSFSSSTSSLSWWPWWESPSQTGSQSWSLCRGVALHLEKACVSFFCFLVLDEAQMKQIMMTMRGRVERRILFTRSDCKSPGSFVGNSELQSPPHRQWALAKGDIRIYQKEISGSIKRRYKDILKGYIKIYQKEKFD